MTLNRLGQYDMRCLAAVVLIFVFTIPALAADTFVPVGTYPYPKADYYPWITYLNRGPSERLKGGVDAQIRLISYRVAVLGDEVETLVFLEEIISGEGDCCRSVLSTRRLDLEEIHDRFGIADSPSDFLFIAWRSATAFEFEIGRRRLVLKGLGGEKVWVTEKADGGGPKSALPQAGGFDQIDQERPIVL